MIQDYVIEPKDYTNYTIDMLFDAALRDSNLELIIQELERRGIYFPIEKHMAGKHDQSTHAPQSRKGVPAGIDLEGKRFDSAARKEFTSKVHAYQDALTEAYRRSWKELGISEANPDFEFRRREWSNAITGRDTTPEGLALKAKIDASLQNNAEYQAARKALEENYIFKEAMNVRDANGVRLGDKDKPNDWAFSDSPEEYLLRKGVGGWTEGDSTDYSADVDFKNSELNERAKGIRVTPEEGARVATDDFRAAAAKGETVVIMPQDKLNQVLSSGRVKTVHETGTSTAGQSTQDYIDHRLIYESAAFGYDNSTPIEARPVSGILKLGDSLPSEALSIYGGKRPTEIVLKPEAKERTTWTAGDSLNTFGTATALDATSFSPSSVGQAAAVYRKATGENYFSSGLYMPNSLREAQVHGGVKVSDIATVRFYSPPSASAISKLDKAGIPYEVIEQEASS